MKRTEKIFNTIQGNFYISEGCKVLGIGLEWSDKLQKKAAFCLFEIDSQYLEAKNVWMSRKR